MIHAMTMRIAYSGLIYRKVDLIFVHSCLNVIDTYRYFVYRVNQ